MIVYDYKRLILIASTYIFHEVKVFFFSFLFLVSFFLFFLSSFLSFFLCFISFFVFFSFLNLNDTNYELNSKAAKTVNQVLCCTVLYCVTYCTV
jgi:hypothetical protein